MNRRSSSSGSKRLLYLALYFGVFVCVYWAWNSWADARFRSELLPGLKTQSNGTEATFEPIITLNKVSEWAQYDRGSEGAIERGIRIRPDESIAVESVIRDNDRDGLIDNFSLVLGSPSEGALRIEFDPSGKKRRQSISTVSTNNVLEWMDIDGDGRLDLSKLVEQSGDSPRVLAMHIICEWQFVEVVPYDIDIDRGEITVASVAGGDRYVFAAGRWTTERKEN